MVDFPYFPMVYPMVPITITGACRGLYCGCTYDSGEGHGEELPGRHGGGARRSQVHGAQVGELAKLEQNN